MKLLVKIFLVVTGVFFIGVAARAQGDSEMRREQQKLIEKAVEKCFQTIGQLDAGGKAEDKSSSIAVKSCNECAAIMRELAGKKWLPVRLRLGAMYFEKESGGPRKLVKPISDESV